MSIENYNQTPLENPNEPKAQESKALENKVHIPEVVDEEAERRRVPDLGFGQYNAEITKQIQRVKNIQQINTEQIDQFAEIARKKIQAMPQNRQKQIFRETIKNITNERQQRTAEHRKKWGSEWEKFEAENAENDRFSINKSKILEYLDGKMYDGKGSYVHTFLRSDIANIFTKDAVVQKINEYNDGRLSKEEINYLLKMLGA